MQRRERVQWLFAVRSRLGYAVRTTRGYWTLIATVKHPTLAGQEHLVIQTLIEPDQIRVSKIDPVVHLFYRKVEGRYVCVVTKRVEPKSGFIMTAYVTDKIKEGHVVWKR